MRVVECCADSISTAPAGSVTRTSPPSRVSCIAGIGFFSWYRAITGPPIRGARCLHSIPNRRHSGVEIMGCRPCLCSRSQSDKSVEAMKRLRRGVSFRGRLVLHLQAPPDAIRSALGLSVHIGAGRPAGPNRGVHGRGASRWSLCSAILYGERSRA